MIESSIFKRLKNVDIVLSTYPLLGRDEEFLLRHQYHLLILDEAQNIKNPRAKASQVVRQIKAKHRLCLTGTPMETIERIMVIVPFPDAWFFIYAELFNKNIAILSRNMQIFRLNQTHFSY